jgi:hypothetical protein
MVKEFNDAVFDGPVGAIQAGAGERRQIIYPKPKTLNPKP